MDPDALAEWRKAAERGRELEEAWDAGFEAYRGEHPALAEELTHMMAGELPGGWDEEIEDFTNVDKTDATRSWSGKVLQTVASRVPNLIGGSADLGSSNKTDIVGGGDLSVDTPDGRVIHFGIREHGMGGVLNGLALHGGIRPFGGTFLIEPKPMEPTKHQYDIDVAAVIAFMQQHDLVDDFKINIENNHATLARHTFAHEIQTAVDAGLFGSIDVNQGDPHSGWDTDEFLHNLYDAVEIMLVLMRTGGVGGGGLNFDAKLRRSSTDPEDLFIGHISSMDTLARGLITAHEILEDSDLEARLSERYASYDDGAGARFERGELGLGELAGLADELGEPGQRSGKQELFESIINRYIR